MRTIGNHTIQKVISGACDDPFSILGMHKTSKGLVIRVFLPNATGVNIVHKSSQKVVFSLEKVDNHGFFEGTILGEKYPFPYMLKVYWGDYHEVREDPYSFGLLLQELDSWLIAEGKFLFSFEKLGAHPINLGGTNGIMFAVWAPNAKRVAVVGDFNFWDGRQNPMRFRKEIGVWELFIPHAHVGQLYKYELIDHNHQLVLKTDPYAFCNEMRPHTATQIIHFPPRVKTLNRPPNVSNLDQPVSIYEVHLGSWRRDQNGYWLSYRQLAEQLVSYVKEMGFTHIELMPIMEHPFDASWGYQPLGLFAPTSRFGSCQDFAYFMEKAHEAGLAVILDWVPGHFPKDDHGLRQFDGTALYEYKDPREGTHSDWDTLVYNYGRYEVKNYLLSNAYYWLDRFGVAGLRFDAVSSMIYRDYSRKEGEWIPNKYGGKENLEAIEFLRETNHVIGSSFPNVVTIAEESTDFAGVTLPPENHGLGFHYKWNMGWMHDTLNYFKLDPVYRKFQHNLLTFGMLYNYSENYILPLSHDEVVYGKGSLLQKMSGDVWQKFANLRAYYGLMWAYPGKKLLFMGGEFGQWNEWDYAAQLDWYLLNNTENNPHRGIQQLVKDLNLLYRIYPSFYQQDMDHLGFNWLVVDDQDNSVFAFERIDRTDTSVVVVSNLTPVVRYNYRVGVRHAGIYAEILNTDASYYGGSNVGNLGKISTDPIQSHGKNHSLDLILPPLATIYLVLYDKVKK